MHRGHEHSQSGNFVGRPDGSSLWSPLHHHTLSTSVAHELVHAPLRKPDQLTAAREGCRQVMRASVAAFVDFSAPKNAICVDPVSLLATPSGI